MGNLALAGNHGAQLGTIPGGGMALAAAELTMSASYATGGDTIPMRSLAGSAVGRAENIFGVMIGGINTATYQVAIVYNVSTDVWKVRAEAAGTEVANATDLSAVKVKLVVLYHP